MAARHTGDAPMRDLIHTPDRRLRVFVSSTLQELGRERAAAREAIERLRLTPVMFESGARPHPPRALYRAYLAQSEIFVGIYWQRYGWIAPDETISGLEDEYLLSAALPRLLYVKQPSTRREPRLAGLLRRIQADDTASYKPFSTPAELAEVIADDLAALLSERFGRRDEPDAGVRLWLPSSPSPLIGRAHELERIATLLADENVRLVTLTGPGGVGKTRLAIAAAEQLRATAGVGAGFVSLASIRDRALVLPEIAGALGIALRGDGATGAGIQTIAEGVAGRELVLILDNFEQVIDAASLVAELLARSRRLRVLATSRRPLRVAAEHEFPVSPLQVADAGGGLSPAAELFMERAEAARPGSRAALDAAAVERIVARLDGLPLAVELAAARVRLLSPDTLFDRLASTLDLLTGGARDLPERQRTLRATLDWSYDLLPGEDRRALAELSVLRGGGSLREVERILSAGGAKDPLELVGSLIESSMITSVTDGDEPRLEMLETIRTYAAERLAAVGDQPRVEARRDDAYAELAERVSRDLRGPRQDDALRRLERDVDNLRATIDHAIGADRRDRAIAMLWASWRLWWLSGRLAEIRKWLERLAALSVGAPLGDAQQARLDATSAVTRFWSGDLGGAARDATAALESLAAGDDVETIATLRLVRAMSAASTGNVDAARPDVEEARKQVDATGNAWLAGFARNTEAYVAMRSGDTAAVIAILDRSARAAAVSGDVVARLVALDTLARIVLDGGDLERAATGFHDVLATALDSHLGERFAYVLSGVAIVLHEAGDDALAARCLGAAAGAREPITAIWLSGPPNGSDAARASVRTALGDAEFDAAAAAGRAVGAERVAREAMIRLAAIAAAGAERSR